MQLSPVSVKVGDHWRHNDIKARTPRKGEPGTIGKEQNMDINAIMQELAQYNRLADETAAIIDGLKDQLKAYMMENHLETLNGNEHKATYKEVTSDRIDTKALKAELPDIAKRYTKTSASMRINFT